MSNNNNNRKPFYWLNKDSRKFLSRGYLADGVQPEDRVKEIGDTVQRLKGIDGYSDKFFDYMSRGWISLSSPVWSSFGTPHGLGISCFSIDIQDDTSDILRGASEIGMMSKHGGGTGGYFGKLRGRGTPISGGGSSNGSVSFMEIYESIINTVSQSGVRRGSFAAYLPINHPDFEEFMTIRNDESPIQQMSMAVTVPEGWMQDMLDGDSDKRKRWLKVLQKRSETGYPYIFFRDNVNNNKPQVYKDKDIDINHSNLCCEILLPTNNKESFVCCLSSVNLEHYDEWKDTDLVEVALVLLDAVMEEFINKASKLPFFEKAVEFAKNQNAIGLGVLGLHSFLQKNMLPFSGLPTKMVLNQIFSNIRAKADSASKKYAELWGEPPLLVGYGERWATKMAIAPTTSSSMILGQVSQSIEPFNSNYFLKDVAKGKFSFKNPQLKEILKSRDKDTDEVWESILYKGGSVQHLSFLTEQEKEVFKTFGEISQMEIVQNVSIIQKYVDQGISLNLMIHPDVPVRDINKLYTEGWKLGIKTFYYQRSSNLAQELGRNILECSSCES